jgi:hypothetical protein
MVLNESHPFNTVLTVLVGWKYAPPDDLIIPYQFLIPVYMVRLFGP